MSASPCCRKIVRKLARTEGWQLTTGSDCRDIARDLSSSTEEPLAPSLRQEDVQSSSGQSASGRAQQDLSGATVLDEALPAAAIMDNQGDLLSATATDAAAAVQGSGTVFSGVMHGLDAVQQATGLPWWAVITLMATGEAQLHTQPSLCIMYSCCGSHMNSAMLPCSLAARKP